MEIKIAKTAGFCFGVRRAVTLAEKIGNEYGCADTYGELIHNPDVINDLEEKHIRAVDDITKAENHVIIRSHGVSPEIIDYLKDSEKPFTDATCPFVSKIHKIAAEYSNKGYIVLIAGDDKHPEIIGIRGYCKGKTYTANTPEELEKIILENNLRHNNLILISQTTFDSAKWHNCKKNIEKLCTKAKIFDTICNATIERQEEAASLSQQCDLIVVVGGSNSSNSKKLADICGRFCKTVFVENSKGIAPDILAGLPFNAIIGITAGASTPAYIIKEVHERMDEIIKDIETGEELSFEQLLDQSLKKVYIGNRVKATVVAVNNSEAVVDIGTKHSGYIPADELSSDSNVNPIDIVKAGDVIDAVVTSINDAEGIVYLSKKKVDSAIGLEKIAKEYEADHAIDGVVSTVVKGGIIVSALGARVFIPASHTGISREGKLETLLKKKIKFKVIEINEARGRVVGSIRLARKAELDKARAIFWENIEVGQKFTGEIKSIESYGVFVDLGGVDGMVHTSELTWGRIKHPREIVSVGEKIDVYVKSFDLEKKRVSLGAKKPEDNPWNKFIDEYKAGDVVPAKIVSITPFGAFAQIIDGVDGLIHISQISLEKVTNIADVLTIGEIVDVKITDIDTEKNRVSLSIKQLLKEDSEEDADSAAEETSENAESDDENNEDNA